MELHETLNKMLSIKQRSVGEERIKKLVEAYKMVDDALPPIPKVYYIMNFYPFPKYEFLGKNTEILSGIPRDEFWKKGLESLVQQMHPKDSGIMVNNVLKDMSEYFKKYKEYNETFHLEYNYRFLHTDGYYINLQERVHMLTHNEKTGPELVLGEVFRLEDHLNIPIKAHYYYVDENNERKKIFSKIYSKDERFRNLTVREQEIALMLCKGTSKKEVVEKIHISPLTLETHKKKIFKKIDVNSIAELIIEAQKSGFSGGE